MHRRDGVTSKPQGFGVDSPNFEVCMCVAHHTKKYPSTSWEKKNILVFPPPKQNPSKLRGFPAKIDLHLHLVAKMIHISSQYLKSGPPSWVLFSDTTSF